MSNSKPIFKQINTSTMRNNFSEIIDITLGKERVKLMRYGKEKAALLTLEDAQIIEYLIDIGEYKSLFEQAKSIDSKK